MIWIKWINPNNAEVFEGSFFLGLQFDPPSLHFLIFQEELIQYQYIHIQLLSNLFKVG